MRATSFGPLAAALLAGWSSATPIMPVDIQVGKPQPDLMYSRALEMAHQPMLEKRLSEQFSLDRSWSHEVLFAGSWIEKEGVGATEAVSLAVKCVECYTKGSVTASLTDKEIINPKVRLDFSGVEAYIDVEVAMSVGAVYSLNLFTSSSPIGLGFPGVSVGVVFYVDLVFSFSEHLDLEGGFWVKLADGSFLEASVFGGHITDHFFDGLSSKSLPVTVYSGTATFKADLRLRVQCGAETEFMGIGGSAELGIYANLIEFVAVLEQTPDCDLQSMEWWDLNVGAFAHLDVVVDYKTIGAIPTVSTTLLTAPTLTQCWIPHGGSSPSRTSTVTTVRSSSTTYGGRTTTSTSYAGKTTTSTSASLAVSSSPYESGSTITSAAFPSGTTGSSGYPTISSSSGRYQIANSSTSSGYDQDVTSTVTSTTVYTITSCAASVVNCPASYQSEILVTETIDIYTTICPASATATSSAAPAQSSAPAPVVIVDIVTDVIVLVPCESPVVETFAPPPATSASALPSLPPVKEVVPSGSVSYVQEAKSTSAAYAVPSSSAGGPGQNGTYAYSTGAVKPTTSSTATGSAYPSKSPVTAGASSAARSVSGAVVVLALVAGTMALM